ncbi:MAG: terminase, partial [Phycisphaerae bacterium]
FSNPRRNEGYFFEAFHAKRNFWVTQNIDAREVEDTDKAVYQQIIDEYGENSPQAKIEVYGQFPDEGDDQFISPHIVDAAIRRDRYQDQYAPRVVGVDPARSGADSTVIVVRQGRDLVAVRRYQGEDTMATVGRVIDAIEEFRPALVVLDEGGLGYGILDRLKEQRYKVVRGVNFSWKSKTPAMYANKRAELWGLMRDWLQTASLPNDRQLKADLTAPHQKPNSTGSIQLESKKDMKSRGLPSPDAADALACTFAYPVAEREARTKERRISVYEGANGLHNSWLGA